MNELAQQLRLFADRVEGGLLEGAMQCAIVLATEGGVAQATYIGRGFPRENAGMHLLATGIQLWNHDLAKERTNSGFSATRGSTH